VGVGGGRGGGGVFFPPVLGLVTVGGQILSGPWRGERLGVVRGGVGGCGWGVFSPFSASLLG